MTIKRNASHHISYRAILLVAAMVALGLASSQMRADTGSCGGQSITLPFTDVPGLVLINCEENRSTVTRMV